MNINNIETMLVERGYEIRHMTAEDKKAILSVDKWDSYAIDHAEQELDWSIAGDGYQEVPCYQTSLNTDRDVGFEALCIAERENSRGKPRALLVAAHFNNRENQTWTTLIESLDTHPVAENYGLGSILLGFYITTQVSKKTRYVELINASPFPNFYKQFGFLSSTLPYHEEEQLEMVDFKLDQIREKVFQKLIQLPSVQNLKIDILKKKFGIEIKDNSFFSQSITHLFSEIYFNPKKLESSHDKVNYRSFALSLIEESL